MAIDELLAILRSRFNVQVVGVYHVKINTKEGVHDLYINSNGRMKFQAYGQRTPVIVTMDELLRQLETYSYDQSDIALMNYVAGLLPRYEGKSGIFCDAGYAAGRARVAIIRGNRGDYDITVRVIDAESAFHAEDWAVKKAIELYPGDEPIHTDNQAAANANKPRAVWIPRSKNREADIFGNMRGRKKKEEDPTEP
jgi:hypothetical protein